MPRSFPHRARPTGLALAAFVGPAGLAAMATPPYFKLRDDAYAAVASLTLLGDSLITTNPGPC